MSYADRVFKETITNILENGVSDADENVRPHWEDGTPAHTVALFGVVNRYDLAKEFPIMTLRRTYWRSALDEIFWIWQKKSNDTHDLKSHVWDEWADADGKIGKAYGYQMAKLSRYRDVTPEGLKKAFGREGDPERLKETFGCGGNPEKLERTLGDSKNSEAPQKVFGCEGEPERLEETLGCGENPEKLERTLGDGGKPEGLNGRTFRFENGICLMDQVDRVIYQLVNDPASRRIMTNLYCIDDLADMALYPCAYSMTFTVIGKKLNAILNQRSQDMVTANNWNIVQYAFIVYALASAYGFEPGELIHVIANCHIYDRHIEIAKRLIEKPEFEAPKLWIDPAVRDFYHFTKDSFRLENYQYNEFSEKIEIAI